MYNSGFYPTPPAVAARMLQGLELDNKTILEPSAGKGDLCDAISSKGFWREYANKRKNIHCCEIEPELQATLRGKGYTLVGADFLTFQPNARYNLIVMNPPFRNGEKHLLHAWDILHEGDLVCLLNADSMRNPQVERGITEQNVLDTIHLGNALDDSGERTVYARGRMRVVVAGGFSVVTAYRERRRNPKRRIQKKRKAIRQLQRGFR